MHSTIQHIFGASIVPGWRWRNLDEKVGQSDLPGRTLGNMIREETRDDSQGQANRQAAEEGTRPRNEIYPCNTGTLSRMGSM